MKRWQINGEADGLVNPFDRGLTYGDGLFETVAIRDGECRFFGAHYARLVVSCRRLSIPVPDQPSLLQGATDLIGADDTGTLKIIVTRGQGERGYRIPDDVQPTCVLGFSPEAPSRSAAAGINLRLCATRVSENPLLAGMKTLNRLEQVLARSEWDNDDIAEGLMLNSRDELICGTMSNLFLVARDQLWTPVLDESGVHGIMRSQVIDLADELGVSCVEQRMSVSVLEEAADVFITNARMGLQPVARVQTESGTLQYERSELTMRLRAGLAGRGVSECAD